MLELKVLMSEGYDDEKEKFVYQYFTLHLEHSLDSLSKWESEYEKPFLDDTEKTEEELRSYVKYMIITPEYPPDIIERMSQDNILEINKHINAKKTATWFNERKQNSNDKSKITSELVYYWMTSYQIPWEAQYWHLNRLFTLIRVFNVKNEKPEKKTPQQIAAERRKLNAQRRAELNSKG